MGVLRRVLGEEAGPTAVGILVPPAQRTFLIVRPRSLAWDLLLVRDAQSSTFHDMDRSEAHLVAQRLYRALEKCSACEPDGVETVPIPQQGGAWLQIVVGSFVLVVCGRVPGKPYEPEVFADTSAAVSAGQDIRKFLCPSGQAEQEVYFNTSRFLR